MQDLTPTRVVLQYRIARPAPRPCAAGAARRGLILERSGAERADCPVVLARGSGRRTHWARPRGHSPRGQVLFCNIAMQDLTPTPAPWATHTNDTASRQAGAGGGDLWGAEERSGRGGARSALRQHSHRTCPNEAPAGRVVSCAMRPCREHRRAVCAFSARPPHHEPPPGPACRDARQRTSAPGNRTPGQRGQVLFCNVAMQDLTPSPEWPEGGMSSAPGTVVSRDLPQAVCHARRVRGPSQAMSLRLTDR
jgi:hypothetical protein